MVIAQSGALILTASATFFEDVRHLVEPETFDLDFATVADVTSHVENGPTVPVLVRARVLFTCHDDTNEHYCEQIRVA